MTIFHRRSCFHLYKYIYIYIFSSLHLGEMLLVRHLKAPSELIPLLCFWWFFFLTGRVCPGSFFHDKLCWSIFCIMDHEALQKNMFGGGGQFQSIFISEILGNESNSLNLIHVYIWYIYDFCSLNSSCMDSMGFEHQLFAPGCQELLQASFPRRGGSSLQIRCRRKSVDLTDMGPSRSTRHFFFQQIYAKVELMIEKLGFIDKQMGNFWRYSLRLSGREFDMKVHL